jgi:antitoxin HicB
MSQTDFTQTEYPMAIRKLTQAEGGGYLVEFPDLPGCMSDGETLPEAVANARAAQSDWIAAMREAGRTIPPPGAANDETYSGKWVLRTPKSLHRSLAERAKREGVSLNMLAVAILAEGLGHRATE